MKNKVIISSILTIALCFSLIAGSTLALFTSESQVNVAVSSGKVSVIATAENLVLGSTLGANVPETSAEFIDNTNEVKLSHFVPGDYVTFDLRIKNDSSITVNYRTVLQMVEDTGLFSGLTVTIGNESYSGTLKYSTWATLAPGSADIIVPVRIELDKSKGIEYMAKSCRIAYRVEAMQGNAPIVEAATTAEQIQAAINTGIGEISLLEDVVIDNPITIDYPMSIDLNGHNLSVAGLNIDDNANVNLSNGTVSSAEETIMTPHIRVANGGKLTLDNVDVKIDKYMNYAAIGYAEYVGISVENGTLILNNSDIVVENTVVRTWNYSYGIAAINGNVVVNGGSITVTSAGGVESDYVTAISSMGNDTITLNNVTVTSEILGLTVGANANLTVNSTNSTFTSITFDNSMGGTHTFNDGTNN